MNILVDKLQNDTMSGIFELTGKSWLPTLVANILYTILSVIILLPLLLGMLNISMDDLTRLQSLSSNPNVMQQELTRLAEGLAMQMSPAVYLSFFLGFMVIMLLASWNYYVAYLSARAAVNGEKPKIGEILSKSINVKVFKLFLTNLVISILYMLCFLLLAALVGLISSSSVAIGVLVMFIGGFFIFALIMRFIMALPIVAYEDNSVMEALKISFNSISMSKGLKYMLLSILALIAIFIAAIVFGLIGGLLSFIPILGALLGQLINTIIGAFVITLVTATFVAIYFKHRGQDQLGNNEIEEHLLYEN